MQRVILRLIFAVMTFLLGLFAIPFWALYIISDSEIETQATESSIHWSNLTKDVRPSLNPEFEKLSDKEREGLRGPVKEVRNYRATYSKTGEIYTRIADTWRESSLWATVYDMNGKQIQNEETFPAGCGYNPPSKRVYDDRGLETACITFNEDGSILSTFLFKHDSDGKPLEDLMYTSGILSRRCNYQYKFDSHGNWIEQIPIVFEIDYEESNISYGLYRRITYYKK